MRLLFIRHGDPDYVNDTLTPTGWQEAKALAEKMKNVDVTQFFVSPLGRAQDTISCTLEATGRSAVTYDWLQEFPAQLKFPENSVLHKAYPDTRRDEQGNLIPRIVWDCLPSFWTADPRYYDPVNWRYTPIAEHSDLTACYDHVTQNFDELMASHGYVRKGNTYTAASPNRDTLAFYCHYGVTCVILSHLMHMSPFILWHSIVTAPTSVTTIYTEEREQGIASFRASQIGDVSHLYDAGMQPSFSARFCETYDCMEERH